MDSDLLKQMCEILEIPPSEENIDKFNSLLNEKFPKCNLCGKTIADLDNWNGSYAHKETWGYESCGKDMECDKWFLCVDCKTKTLDSLPLICSSCHKTIPEVMAELHHKHMGSSFYGDFKAALDHYHNNRHLGLSYTKILERILCEICYEQLITKFKLPITIIEEDGVIPEEMSSNSNSSIKYNNFDYPGRLGRTLNYRYQDCIWFETYLPWNELVEVRTGPLRSYAFINLFYRVENEQFIARIKKENPDWEPHIMMATGDNCHYQVPISWLKTHASKIEGLDPTKLVLKEKGTLICIGSAEIYATDILESSFLK